MAGNYRSLYTSAITNPENFWRQAAAALDWDHSPATILDTQTAPNGRWFPDGQINACFNALDRHVRDGRGRQTAIIYDSPVTQTKNCFSYADVQLRVSKIAGMLAEQGVRTGDRVVIYMPMIPEAVMAMLACARIGAIHSVVFGGFAANELAVRIDDAAPRLILAASCGIESNRTIPYKPMLNEAVQLARHKPQRCIVLQREQCLAELDPGLDLDWHTAVNAALPVDCVPVPANHPLYILYTSGTTGQPKGVVHDTAGYLVALHWSMKNIYDVNPGEVFWAASDVGWVVGHSYITYGPLLNGSTTLLYEGKPVGTPDAGAFWRVIQEYRVRALFTAPTAFRAIKKEDPKGELIDRYNLDCLESLYLAGERCDPDTLEWAQQKLQIPVIDHWWQTETGWAICANCKGIELKPVKAGSPTLPVPGYTVHVLDAEGRELPSGKLGALAIKLPLPPGVFTALWQNDTKFFEAYFSRFPGYYETGDAGYIDEDGYVFVMSRTDDVINVAGHRLSTGAMEEVLAAHPDVAECAVLGAADKFKGQIPIGLVVLKAGTRKAEAEITQRIVAMVRGQIGPVAAFKHCAVVKRLPKTRSGKILRGTLRKIADGEAYKIPATIDEPAVLGEVTEKLKALGYPQTESV